MWLNTLSKLKTRISTDPAGLADISPYSLDLRLLQSSPTYSLLSLHTMCVPLDTARPHRHGGCHCMSTPMQEAQPFPSTCSQHPPLSSCAEPRAGTGGCPCSPLRCSPHQECFHFAQPVVLLPSLPVALPNRHRHRWGLNVFCLVCLPKARIHTSSCQDFFESFQK